MKKEIILVPQSFEFLFSHMFGRKPYRDFMGEHIVSDWKKHILKAVKAIRKSILANIDTTDEFHKNKLLELCNQATQRIKEAKRKDQINLSAIECFIRITLELMGGMPYHWEMRVVNRLQDWKLNRHRKLAYLQTPNQKANLILYLTNWPPYCDRFSDKEKGELFHKFRYDFEGDGNRFIEWFKQKHKDIYLELF